MILKKIIHKRSIHGWARKDGSYGNDYHYCIYLFGILIYHINVRNITEHEADKIFN